MHSTAETTDKDKDKKRKLHFSRTARQSPDIFEKSEGFRILSITPSLYPIYNQCRYTQEVENEELSESYEIMMSEFSSKKDSDNFEQCFRNLVKFEKISVRESFSKRPS